MPTQVGIHDFSRWMRRSRGWRAFARHDEVQRPESRCFGRLVLVMAELVTGNDLTAVRADLQASDAATRRELEAAMDNLSLRLTVRLGGMIAIAVAILAAIIRL